MTSSPASSNAPEAVPVADRVPVGEKLAFASGDVASNFLFQSFMIFLVYFYTDVFGLSPVAVAWMLLVTRVWDAVNDPLMGIIADRTQTRWGKYRPFLLWFAVPFGLAGALMYTTPSFEGTAKIAYAYVTYTGMMMVYTAINIPYSALMGVMTPSPTERTALSSFRFVGAFSGGTVLKFCAPPMVRYFGGVDAAGNVVDEQFGYQVTMSIFAAAATLLWLVNFVATRERVTPPRDQKTDTRRDLSELVRNGPWWVLVVLGLFTLAAFSIRGGVVLYYFKYVVDPRYSNFEFYFLTAGGIANVIGAGCAGLLCRYVSKHILYAVLMITASVLMCGFFVLPPDAIVLIFGLEILTNLLLGPTSPIVWAMYTDCADYAEYLNGRRSTGLVMSASSFAQKMGWTVGGWGTGMLLSVFGYVAKAPVQTAGTVLGLKLMLSFIPAALAIAGAVVCFVYKLTDPFAWEVEKRLAYRRNRRASFATGAAVSEFLQAIRPVELELEELHDAGASGTVAGRLARYHRRGTSLELWTVESEDAEVEGEVVVVAVDGTPRPLQLQVVEDDGSAVVFLRILRHQMA